MEIDKVFKSLHPYLKGVKMAEEYSLVEAQLKKSWVIPAHQSIKYQITKEENGFVHYLFYGENGEGFDDIINWLEIEVIFMNIETEKKEQLLREKVAELKNIFETSSLDELNSLDFLIDKSEPLLPPGGLDPSSPITNQEDTEVIVDESKEDGVTEEA